MMSFLLGVLASAAVVAIVYFGYWLSFKHCSKGRAYAECWWLSQWNCFRLVIRNMHDEGNLTSLRYRSWIRSLVPAGPGSSVNTFVDQELSNGERIILPSGQDLPILCFRIEQRNEHIIFCHTDKRGNLLDEINVGQTVEGIFAEFSARIRSWFLFKHEIVRIFMIPHELTIKGSERDLFKEYLLLLQAEEEARVKLVFQTAQEVAVSI